MLTKTSIISCLMLITFSPVGKGFSSGEDFDANYWQPRIPSRLRNRNGTSTFRPFIVNGTPAYIEDYPFLLSMRIFGQFVCGASVIGSRWALTAAHCLEWQVTPDLITLYGGSSNRLEGGVLFDLEHYELHPDFDPVIYDFDVAVMRIEGSFLGHPNIKVVRLATDGCHHTCAGAMIRLAGWGYNEHGIIPVDLYEIEQSIQSNDECYESWGGDITSRMLCATVENGVDSCNGGAVLKGWLQVGIISFGSANCGFEMPSVFTRIEDPAIRDFIRQQTGI